MNGISKCIIHDVADNDDDDGVDFPALLPLQLVPSWRELVSTYTTDIISEGSAIAEEPRDALSARQLLHRCTKNYI